MFVGLAVKEVKNISMQQPNIIAKVAGIRKQEKSKKIMLNS